MIGLYKIWFNKDKHNNLMYFNKVLYDRSFKTCCNKDKHNNSMYFDKVLYDRSL
jgi:hypothetical protein